MLADAVLVLHFAVAAFIAGGLPLVWLGAALDWRWIRNARFRYLHVSAIAIVAIEALAGAACPLTLWEDALRGGTRADSFVGRWLRTLLFYDAPSWVFTTAYVAWAAMTLVTLRLIPPHRSGARG